MTARSRSGQAMFRAFAPPSSTSAVKSATTPRPRPKRTQVTRACDWCRVHRIKCDNHHPCSTCKSRGGPCTMTGVTKQATLPHVYREVERLRLRVQELELLESAVSSSGSGSGSGSSGSSDSRPAGKRFQEGVHIRTARSPHKTWYGEASLFHFISRIDAILSPPESPESPRTTATSHYLLPNSASMLIDGPMPFVSSSTSTTSTSTSTSSSTSTSASTPVAPIAPMGGPIDSRSVQTAGDFLTATQEEYFLGLFWQSYYTSCPILDEVQFKEHYQSLWATTSTGYERKPSALVDIVLAVCMQYGMALPGSGGRRGSVASSASSAMSRAAEVINHDAAIAGRWHYQRCQTLLASELETPTLSTLQCHILSCMYLCCGSFENMADSTCGIAVRTAYMLGLHLEPPESMPVQEREMRRRLWWTLYVLETKMSMKLGRPFLLHESSTTCNLPSADREIAMLAGSSFAPLGGDVTWLTWNLENTKLILAVRATYTAFYDKVPSTMNARDGHWEDAQTVGAVADVLDTHTKRLDHWLTNLPDALKTKRENNGTPFSTDRSALEIEPFAPLWLQRQRLLLELMYHNLCTNLYRPFIPFAPTTSPANPLSQADTTAMKCAAHAMILTHILHQVLSSTSILTGWHEAFQWQWSAAITLVGFVLAYPQNDLTREARNTIDLSVAVFESFGDSFAVAASAAETMRDLSAKVDLRIEQSQEKQVVVAQDFKKPPHEMQIQLQLDTISKEPIDQSFIYGDFTTVEMVDRPLCFDTDDTTEMQRMLFETTDMDFAINTYNNLEMLWSSMNYG